MDRSQDVSSDPWRKVTPGDLEALTAVAPGVPYLRLRSDPAPFRFLGEGVEMVTGFPARAFEEDPELWRSRLHPEDRAQVEGWLARISGDETAEEEYRFRHRDGGIRWIRDRARPASGGLAGHWLDVTEVRRVEGELAAHTWALRERGKELRCVYGLSNLFQRPGASTEEVLEGVVDLLPPAWQHPAVACARIVLDGCAFATDNFRPTPWRQTCELVVAGRTAGTVEVGYLAERPGGDEGPFLEEEAALLASVAGRLGRWLEWKRAEERVRWESSVNGALASLAQALLRPHAIDEISDLVLAHAQDLTGSAHGYVGYVDPETGYLVCPTLTRGIWEECRVSDKSPVFETSGGLTGWVLAQQEPLLTNDPTADPRSTGTPPGHVAVTRFLSVPARASDQLVGQISLANAPRDYGRNDLELVERLATLYALAVERMWREEELRGARTRAEAASRAKSEFLANVSHELRTPLNGVLGAVDLVRDLTEPSGEQDRYLRMAHTSAERLARMIDGVLDLAGLDRDTVPLEPRPVDLLRLVEQTVHAFAEPARGKGLSLVLHVAPGVPPRVHADPARLRQILEILLDNALKFTDRGGVKIRVEPVRGGSPAGPNRRRVRFSVTDSGIGIPADRVSHLFQSFTQLDGSSTRRHGGAGLGLAIASRLVEKMEGEIAAEGEPGRGSTFSFAVPLRTVSAELPGRPHR